MAVGRSSAIAAAAVVLLWAAGHTLTDAQDYGEEVPSKPPPLAPPPTPGLHVEFLRVGVHDPVPQGYRYATCAEATAFLADLLMVVRQDQICVSPVSPAWVVLGTAYGGYVQCDPYYNVYSDCKIVARFPEDYTTPPSPPVLPPPPPSPGSTCNYRPDTSWGIPDFEYLSYYSPNVDACCTDCWADSGLCSGYVYHDGACFLKAETARGGGFTYMPGAIAGEIRGASPPSPLPPPPPPSPPPQPPKPGLHVELWRLGPDGVIPSGFRFATCGEASTFQDDVLAFVSAEEVCVSPGWAALGFNKGNYIVCDARYYELFAEGYNCTLVVRFPAGYNAPPAPSPPIPPAHDPPSPSPMVDPIPRLPPPPAPVTPQNECYDITGLDLPTTLGLVPCGGQLPVRFCKGSRYFRPGGFLHQFWFVLSDGTQRGFAKTNMGSYARKPTSWVSTSNIGYDTAAGRVACRILQASDVAVSLADVLPTVTVTESCWDGGAGEDVARAVVHTFAAPPDEGCVPQLVAAHL